MDNSYFLFSACLDMIKLVYYYQIKNCLDRHCVIPSLLPKSSIMKKFRSLMKKKWHCITANLLLFSSSSIFALDVYSIQDNTLRIRNVDLGADTYTDVKIKVGNILNIYAVNLSKV